MSGSKHVLKQYKLLLKGSKYSNEVITNKCDPSDQNESHVRFGEDGKMGSKVVVCSFSDFIGHRNKSLTFLISHI